MKRDRDSVVDFARERGNKIEHPSRIAKVAYSVGSWTMRMMEKAHLLDDSEKQEYRSERSIRGLGYGAMALGAGAVVAVGAIIGIGIQADRGVDQELDRLKDRSTEIDQCVDERTELMGGNAGGIESQDALEDACEEAVDAGQEFGPEEDKH